MANEANLNKDPDVAREIGKLGGRPKGSKSTKTIIRKYLEAMQDMKNPMSGEFENLSYWEAMILKQIAKAIKQGDTHAFRELIDRLDGKPKQEVDQNISGGISINIIK